MTRSVWALVFGFNLLTAAAASRAALPDPLQSLGDPMAMPYRVTGAGHATDSSHPMHPGDSYHADLRFRMMVDPEVGEAVLEFESGHGEKVQVDRYFLRRGHFFQVDAAGREVAATPLGDVSAAAVAALHPRLVAQAIRERRGDLRALPGTRDHLFAWCDVLWRCALDLTAGRVTGLERLFHHERFGDSREEVRYEEWRPEGAADMPGRTVVLRNGVEVARLSFNPAETIAPADMPRVPFAAAEDQPTHAIHRADIMFRQAADGLFTVDFDSLNTRVFVAEFSDHLLVFEGAYSARVCQVLADAARERFGKPVRWFAFSHLHGQYIGGVRSWVHEGATIVVPPTTAPLIQRMVDAPNSLAPDAQQLDPKPLSVEQVPKRRHFEDAANALDLYNIDSGHTDEYLIAYLPRQRVLLSGDLFFLRPGKPVAGRSQKLCETVASLGLDPDQVLVTWPLSGYGTKSMITGEEWRAACGPVR